MPRFAAALAIAAIFVAGCAGRSDVIHGSTADQVIDDIQRVEKSLPPAEVSEFQQAYRTLLAMTVTEMQGDEAKVTSAVVRRFSGKTPRQIIKDYDALDAATRIQFTAGVEEARIQAAEMKAENERRAAELGERRK